jgi:hypothetical protein
VGNRYGVLQALKAMMIIVSFAPDIVIQSILLILSKREMVPGRHPTIFAK